MKATSILQNRNRSSAFYKHLPKTKPGLSNNIGGEFRCLSCKCLISCAHWRSGVNNRNHCPCCLWSRHLDLFKAGDRLSACKAGMRPIGLTIKRTPNKYSHGHSGELMLVHCCVDCGKISINRIAADDDPQALAAVFQESCQLTPPARKVCQSYGIMLLGSEARSTVQIGLFGK